VVLPSPAPAPALILRRKVPAAAVPAAPPRVFREVGDRHCPACGSEHTRRHGSFPLLDGTRRQRRRCRDCGRTFSECTATPLAYLKKSHLWPDMAACMARGLPIRQTAAKLGVAVSTAFAWRHLLLAPLAGKPLPLLTGAVQAGEAVVPYSEKGSRRSGGPGSWRNGKPSDAPFRRIRDGRPSFVLLAQAPAQPEALELVCQGRPEPEALQRHLSLLLGAGASVCSGGLVAYGEACKALGVKHQDAWHPEAKELRQENREALFPLRWALHGWVERRFRGVATKYLQHYLRWLRMALQIRGLAPALGGAQLLTEAGAALPPTGTA